MSLHNLKLFLAVVLTVLLIGWISLLIYASHIPPLFVRHTTLTLAHPPQRIWPFLQQSSHRWSSDTLSVNIMRSAVPDTLIWEVRPARRHYHRVWRVLVEPIPPDSSRLYLTDSTHIQAILLRLCWFYFPERFPQFERQVLDLIDSKTP